MKEEGSIILLARWKGVAREEGEEQDQSVKEGRKKEK